MRLDLVVCRHLADLSSVTRTRVQRWMRAGGLSVNGRTVHRSASRAALGDAVRIQLPGLPARAAMQAEPLPLQVLFEDTYLLVVNKPPGMVVHPTYRHATGTLMNGLLWRARAWPAEQRPSLVGRLDKMTSGVVVVAKTRAVHAALQRTLRGRRARRSIWRSSTAVSQVSEGRSICGWRETLAIGGAWSRPAIRGVDSVTHVERLARARPPRAGLALLRCRLATGRTHQIRVHLSASGWPIVGDPVYGEPRWSHVADPVLAAALRNFRDRPCTRGAVTFPHPVTGRRVGIEAPPTDFADLARASLSCTASPLSALFSRQANR